MKHILVSFLALGVGLVHVTVPLMIQPSWAQIQNPKTEEVKRLLEQANQQAAQQGQRPQAIETYQQVLAIARQLKDRQTEAIALNEIGYNYYKITQPQRALDYSNQALSIFREVGNRSKEAEALNIIGWIYNDTQQIQKALEYFNQALPITKEVGDRSQQAKTLNNIASIYGITGQTQKALEYLNQALPITREVGDYSQEAKALNSFGIVYFLSGQPQKALEYFNQALPITREVGDRSNDHSEEAKTLTGLGEVYFAIGQPQKAQEYYNQALSICKKVGDRSGEATVLIGIGSLYYKIGNIEQLQKALDYFNQALSIFKEVGNRGGEAEALVNAALIHYNLGQPQKALDYSNQALSISRELGVRLLEGVALRLIAISYYGIEQPQKALDYSNQALSIFTEVGYRLAEASTLYDIAGLYILTNRSTEAITYIERSIEITLKTRSSLQRNNKKQTRQKFLESYGYKAIALVNLLIDQNKLDEAYEWLNIATTADLADYTRLINAKVANAQAQQAIDEWNQKNQQLEFLQQQLQKPNNFSEALSLQIRELEKEVFKQAEDISRRFPEVAELFETTPTDIAQLRDSIPQGTVVVQPVLLTNVIGLPNTVAIFVVTKDKLTVTKKTIDPTEFKKLVTDYRTQLQDRFNTDFSVSRKKLYDILIRPVEDQIQTASPKQLSIIPTATLRYIPFETLYDSKTNQYLIQKYPVNYLTRLSKLSLQQRVDRNSRTLSVLALGNPLPTPRDLPESKTEANQLIKIFPGSEAYIGQKATLDTFKTQAPRFSILHLGTHGCFQSGGCPNLKMEENTLLFADNQKYNIADAALLGLKNTELITLSACQTAKEADSNGEEISGIAYLFERAGARSVIASLWNAEDSTTKDIMIEFYENLKKGMSKGEALRQAKLTQLERKPDLHPFFWSPFVLIGDAR
jgi:CHAT domain-containing protein/Tfp pilus assembly protein PilF